MTTEESKERKRRGFSVYIVESPSPLDLYHKRFEGELLMKALKLAKIPSEHKLAVNSEAFNMSFTVGLSAYLLQPNALLPLLHISAHGGKEGIRLTSGEEINWHELRDIIMPINERLKGGLILCMSSCQGIQACRMVMMEGRLPFLAIIGHSGEPSWSDTAVAYATFYHLLAEGYCVPEAVKAMRTASGKPGFQQIKATEVRNTIRDIYAEEVEEARIKALANALRKMPPRLPYSHLAEALEEELKKGEK